MISFKKMKKKEIFQRKYCSDINVNITSLNSAKNNYPTQKAIVILQ